MDFKLQWFGLMVVVLLGIFVSSSRAEKWNVKFESGYPGNQRAVGIPNITLTLILEYETVERVKFGNKYFYNAYFIINFSQNYTSTFAFGKISNVATEKTAVIKTILTETPQGNFSISVQSWNTSFGNKYVSPTIIVTYCPEFTNLQTPKQLLNSDRQFGSKATVSCKNSVFVDNSTLMYRSAVVACDAFAKWNDSNLSCYEGQFVDVNNAGQKQTLTYNTPVLFYCDPFNPNMNQINLTLDDQVFFGSKYAWGNVTLTPSHHNSRLICKQTSANLHQSQSKSVILDVQYPPLIDPNTTVDAEVTLGKNDFVEYKFKSNPPTPPQGAVVVYKDGIAVKNMYYFTNQTETQVVLHFKTVTNSDDGKYFVVINSGDPFTVTERVTIRVRVTKSSELHVDCASMAVIIPLGILLAVVSVVAVVLAVKLCKNNKQLESISINKTHEQTRTTNVYNKTQKQAPGQRATPAQTSAPAQVPARAQNPNRLRSQVHQPTGRNHNYANQKGQKTHTEDYIDMQPEALYEYSGP